MGSNVARLSAAALMVTLVGVAGAVAACSSFGSGDGPSPEAGAPDVDEATADGAVEASGEDASCSRYCACQVGAAFCSDFDQADLLGEWDQKTTSDGGVLAPIASDRSSPNALDVSTLASAEANGAIVKKAFAGDVAKLSLSFDLAPTLLATPVGASASTEFVALAAFDGANRVGDLRLVSTQSGMKLLVPNGATESTDLPSLPNTRPWVRVHIEVRAGLVTVRYDDAPAVAAGAPFPATGTSISFRLGLTTAAASGANRVAYDNVVVRFD